MWFTLILQASDYDLYLRFLLEIYAFSFVETTTVSAPSFFLASPVQTIDDNNVIVSNYYIIACNY